MKENSNEDKYLVATGDQGLWALTCCTCSRPFGSTNPSETTCYICQRAISKSFNYNKTEGFYGYGTNEFDEE